MKVFCHLITQQKSCNCLFQELFWIGGTKKATVAFSSLLHEKFSCIFSHIQPRSKFFLIFLSKSRLFPVKGRSYTGTLRYILYIYLILKYWWKSRVSKHSQNGISLQWILLAVLFFHGYDICSIGQHWFVAWAVNKIAL